MEHVPLAGSDRAKRVRLQPAAVLEDAYGPGEVRRFTSIEDAVHPGAERLALDDLAGRAAAAVRDGRA